MFSYKGLTMGDLKVERNNLRRIMCDLTKHPSDYFFQLFMAGVYKYLLTYTAFGAKYKHANQTELITLSLEDIIDSEYAKYYIPLQSLEQLVVNDVQNNDGSPSFERNIKSMLNDTDTYNDLWKLVGNRLVYQFLTKGWKIIYPEIYDSFKHSQIVGNYLRTLLEINPNTGHSSFNIKQAVTQTQNRFNCSKGFVLECLITLIGEEYLTRMDDVIFKN